MSLKKETTTTAPPAVAQIRPHLLVADDESSIRDLMRAVLRAGGYDVTLAEDGEDAIRKHGEAARPFDLVLIDYYMPGLNGWKTVEQIRQRDPLVKAILLSGSFTEGIGAGHLGLDEVHYLEKPFTTQTLLAAVRNALGARFLCRSVPVAASSSLPPGCVPVSSRDVDQAS